MLNPKIAEAKPEYEKSFLREAKLATKMRHPNLVAVLSLMCAKKLEDRLESPKAVMQTFTRIGYSLLAAVGLEFVAEEDESEEETVTEGTRRASGSSRLWWSCRSGGMPLLG